MSNDKNNYDICCDYDSHSFPSYMSYNKKSGEDGNHNLDLLLTKMKDDHISNKKESE